MSATTTISPATPGSATENRDTLPMLTIDQKPLSRIWGTFNTKSPLIQTYAGGVYTYPAPDKRKVVLTRTWNINGVPIPVISGDSMRGRMRRALAFDLFDRLKIAPKSLPLEAVHLLLVGGALRENPLDETYDRLPEVRAMIPSLALLGGTMLGGFAAGALRMGSWVAQSQQTPSPALHVDEDADLPDAESLFMEENLSRNGSETLSYFRMDEIWKVFPNSTKESKSGDSDDSGSGGKDGSQTVSLPHSYRVVVPGTTFAGWAALASYRGSGDSPLLRSCMRHAIDLALPHGKEITLGLRAANGYGVVEIDWEGLDDLGTSDAYLSHVEDNAEEIRALLATKLESKQDPSKVAKTEKQKASNAERKAKKAAEEAAKKMLDAPESTDSSTVDGDA